MAHIFDRAGALAQAAGDPVLLREILGLFLTECPGWRAGLRAAVADGDAAALQRTAHTLKGSLGVLAAADALAAAERLESPGSLPARPRRWPTWTGSWTACCRN
jgi:HPt (histidine-containing phosphotransfer) domain-containing protein